MTKQFLLGAAFAAWLVSAPAAFALPSWEPTDTYTSFQVTLENGTKSPVTLLRDHEDRNRFYHLPLAPRLFRYKCRSLCPDRWLRSRRQHLHP